MEACRRDLVARVVVELLRVHVEPHDVRAHAVHEVLRGARRRTEGGLVRIMSVRRRRIRIGSGSGSII